MKVLSLMAIPTLTGAAAPALDRLRLLRRSGADITVGLDRYRPHNLEAILEAEGFPILKDLRLSTVAPPWVAAKDLVVLVRRLRQSPPDVLECHLSHDHLFAVWARRLAGLSVPIVRHVHAERSLERRLGQAWLWRQTQAAVTSTEAHKAMLSEAFGMSPSRVFVQQGMTDTTRFHPPLNEERQDARRRFGFKEQDRVAVHVTRLKPGRRLESLMDAFESAHGQAPCLRLLLVGAGESESTLRRWVVEHDLPDAVVFTGYMDRDLPTAYHAADACVQPEVGNDACCRAILEAAASGLPVYAAEHIAAAREFITDEMGGLFHADERDSLARCLVRLAQIPSETLRMQGETARTETVRRMGKLLLSKELADFYRSFIHVEHLA